MAISAVCCRWLHGMCDKICSDEDAELAMDYGYQCLLCRPRTGALGPCKLSQSYKQCLPIEALTPIAFDDILYHILLVLYSGCLAANAI